MAGYRECLTYTVPTSITGTNDTGLNTSDTAIIQMSTGACGANVLSTITYSVQTGASGQPALFKNDGATTSELVEGIENMQILYGVDTDTPINGPNYYVSSDKVTNANWPKVISIRISLLAVTLDNNLTTEPVPYTYNEITTTPPDITTTPLVKDLKVRRVFTSTIALRNRLL